MALGKSAGSVGRARACPVSNLFLKCLIVHQKCIALFIIITNYYLLSADTVGRRFISALVKFFFVLPKLFKMYPVSLNCFLF